MKKQVEPGGLHEVDKGRRRKGKKEEAEGRRSLLGSSP
jgi:hypothetical protein